MFWTLYHKQVIANTSSVAPCTPGSHGRPCTRRNSYFRSLVSLAHRGPPPRGTGVQSGPFVALRASRTCGSGNHRRL